MALNSVVKSNGLTIVAASSLARFCKAATFSGFAVATSFFSNGSRAMAGSGWVANIVKPGRWPSDRLSHFKAQKIRKRLD